MSTGNFKLKEQRNITTHLLKQPKSEMLTVPNVSEDVEQWELSSIAAEYVK